MTSREPPDLSCEDSIGRTYLDAARDQLAKSARKIKHCLSQLSDEQVWWRPTEAQNSIANLVLHLCGNVRQWITSAVGGEPDQRNRPQEFAERGPIAMQELIGRLEEVLQHADAVLQRVSAGQLLERRRIQGFDETGLGAIFHSVAHFQGHTQEIICLTRMQLGDSYQFDWTPRTSEQQQAASGQ